MNYRIHGVWDNLDYHSHREYEIFLFHSGTCRYLIHNQIYDLEPGDILIMDGLALHKPNVPPNGNYVRSVVHFPPQWIKGMLKEIGGLYLLDVFEKLHHCLIRTKVSEEAKQLEMVVRRLEEINRISTQEDMNSQLEMKALLLQALTIIHRLGNLESLKASGEKVEKAEHAENIAEFIQKNYMKRITIDSIAQALNISKSYVSHVFKEMTGFTIMEYVMGSRLTQAKYLLEAEPEKPLKEIASESGFESISHFSRYFKSKVGVTAKAYRKSRLKLYSEENS
ncbi:AraC family transcriptional regulator [Oceanobacillus piezotolerans]|uniref:AraC family transcriptional regulator n=1 Tax=Oceanobacillus piezotolerans TaxID=2448030 RepID=A0A498D3K2_9BACI|nr:AraC family transcriptional regulator [Oceanobacillus piezotolerans]RLL40709.1 AraC family transcriptional regulator [Oceanobacillus piezotolerans]